MTIAEMQAEIIRLKKEKDVCVLAHSYQTRDIIEVADFTGDSYKLSTLAATVKNRAVLMCGVRFMAETVKILSPEKTVYLANPAAGCPMAEQLSEEDIVLLKKKYPGYAVVAYINTTSRLKTHCDVCVTSSSAVEAVRKLPQKDILFIPDCNLGAYVKQQVPEKNFAFFSGGCPIHARVTARQARAAKEAHPGAPLAVHPECTPEVTALADYVGSTAGIMKFARESDAPEMIIGTETSIVQHLAFEFPERRFYALTKELICPNMRLTTLPDVLGTLRGVCGEEIILDAETMDKARKCLDTLKG